MLGTQDHSKLALTTFCMRIVHSPGDKVSGGGRGHGHACCPYCGSCEQDQRISRKSQQMNFVTMRNQLMQHGRRVVAWSEENTTQCVLVVIAGVVGGIAVLWFVVWFFQTFAGLLVFLLIVAAVYKGWRYLQVLQQRQWVREQQLQEHELQMRNRQAAEAERQRMEIRQQEWERREHFRWQQQQQERERQERLASERAERERQRLAQERAADEQRALDWEARMRGVVALTLEEMLELSPTDFELVTGKLLHAWGHHNIRHVGGSGDQGVDLTSTDAEGLSTVVQCKRYAPGHAVSSPEVQKFIGMMHVVHHADRGIFVTTSTFTRDAFDLGRQHSIRLIDGQQLAEVSELILRANRQHAPAEHARTGTEGV